MPPPDPPSADAFTLTVEDPSTRTGPQGGVRPPDGAPVRSHLPDGLVLTWLPPDDAAGIRFAVDAEYADQPVPAAMARRYGSEDFWTRWTRAEVCAKLADTPILVWLAAYGLPADPAAGTGSQVHTLDLEGPGGRTIRVSAGSRYAGPVSRAQDVARPSVGRTVVVTLSGVRSRTHLVHVASYVRHLLATCAGEVVVRSMGTAGFLGRTTVTAEDVVGFLPDPARLAVHTDPDPAALAPGRDVDWVYLAVGAPGIKPWLRMAAHQPLHRPHVVVVDEGLGTYGTWRTRRDAWVRQGGGLVWPTVRALAVSSAVGLLTDERWPLYRRLPGGGPWQVHEPVAEEFRRRVVLPEQRAARAVYLAQPWVAMGVLDAEDHRRHLHAVEQAVREAGLDFVIRPHPADHDDSYRGLPVSVGTGPAELDPEVVASQVALGTTSTALLNLAALYGMQAVRVQHGSLAHLDDGLGADQRALLDQFVPTSAPPEDLTATIRTQA